MPEHPKEAPPPEVLILGCTGVGKTHLNKQLARMVSPGDKGVGEEADFYLTSTTGLEREEVEARGRRLVLLEVGGPMQRTWPDFYRKCAGVVFVIDRAHRGQLGESTTAFFDLLRHPDLASKPVILAFTKSDAENAMSRLELGAAMHLDAVLSSPSKTSPIHIIECSGRTGEGLSELLDLLGSFLG
jgi:ADP-ribosylation factor-like protein 13B